RALDCALPARRHPLRARAGPPRTAPGRATGARPGRRGGGELHPGASAPRVCRRRSLAERQCAVNTPSKLTQVAVLWTVALGLGAGCASLRHGVLPDEVEALRVAGKARGLDLPDPLALNGKTIAEVRGAVGLWGSETERMRRLVRFLIDG